MKPFRIKRAHEGMSPAIYFETIAQEFVEWANGPHGVNIQEGCPPETVNAAMRDITARLFQARPYFWLGAEAEAL